MTNQHNFRESGRKFALIFNKQSHARRVLVLVHLLVDFPATQHYIRLYTPGRYLLIKTQIYLR